MTVPCRLCGAAVEMILDLGAHPIAHRHLASPDATEFAHPVRLAACRACGLAQLIGPIPPHEMYSHYAWLSSWKAQTHAPGVARAIARLAGRTDGLVLEIGSNDGMFLDLMRGVGFARVVGLEPAQDARDAAMRREITTVAGYFEPAMAERIRAEHGRCGVLVARHVLEHVQDLDAFREAMTIVLEPGGIVAIEVPDSEMSFRSLDYSAIWEEHVNYFSLSTLERWLTSARVNIVSTERFVFSGQALLALGRHERAGVARASGAASFDLAQEFGGSFPAFREELHRYLSSEASAGRIIVYGAGCRAASFLNFLGVAEHIAFVVDDQAEKQGRWMPGSRLPILSGDRVAEPGIGLCLLAVNAEMEDRVLERWRPSAPGVRFASILPPSPRLIPPFPTAPSS